MSDSAASSPGPARPPIRWWPAVVVLVLAAMVLGRLWLGEVTNRQETLFATYATVLLTGGALLVWMGFFSRLRGRVRLGILAGLLGIALALVLLVRIEGVSGDFLPILTWRWSGETLGGKGPQAEGPSPLGYAFDYPQFLGPERSGTVRGVRLARDWSAQPPKEVWRRPVGPGWSAFAVAGGRAVTQEQREDEELVVAYDLATGQVLWVHADRERYESAVAGVGPRATPTLHEGRVYAVGSTGLLSCLDLATGELLWQRNLIEENGAKIPTWGKSSSPLVVDGLVVVSAGGSGGRSLVAYHRETGEPAWSGGDDASAYASPLLASLAGVPQILLLNEGSVAAHHPETGEVLWQVPWSRAQANVAQPVPLPGDRLLVSTGYGIGSKLYQLRADDLGNLEAELLWSSPRLKAKFTNVVFHQGRIYGLDDGVMTCLDPETGERCWKGGRYGHGQVILAEDLLLVQAEDGRVLLLEPNPDELRELGSFEALEGKTWNSPALAGRFLLVRNDREAACYELPLDS